MAVKCPQCGAEFDVTLFTFGRRIRCDCGAWVDVAVGRARFGEERLWMFTAAAEAVAMVASLLVVRSCGYRLVRLPSDTATDKSV